MLLWECKIGIAYKDLESFPRWKIICEMRTVVRQLTMYPWRLKRLWCHASCVITDQSATHIDETSLNVSRAATTTAVLDRLATDDKRSRRPIAPKSSTCTRDFDDVGWHAVANLLTLRATERHLPYIWDHLPPPEPPQPVLGSQQRKAELLTVKLRRETKVT